MNIDALLENVPAYDRFLTVNELYGHARTVVETHPHLARLTEIGTSQAGEAIPMVSIGEGAESILLYALPHPNEPIGAMLVRFLLDELLVDPTLREGRTWHLIPSIDPDGTRLNEGWFDGPFTLKNYCRNFYRPKGENQAEWTFPIQYKTFSFDRPIPETRALMRAIDITRPAVLYGLHNAGFGGAYYYISHPLEGAYADFHRLPLERDLPLSLGEPEMPYLTELHPAVFRSASAKEAYDYYERYADGDPAAQMFGGASCTDYAATVSDPFSLIAEVPYFKTKKIGDRTQIQQTRGEVLLSGLDAAEELLRFAQGVIDTTSELIHTGELLKDASTTFVRLLLDQGPGTRAWIEAEPSMREPATVAQKTDAEEIRLFYHCLTVSMYRRAMAMQLEQEENADLRRQYEKLDSHIDSLMDRIGDALAYETVAIRDMVQIQYGALLAALNALER